jgi:hypothetical protein
MWTPEATERKGLALVVELFGGRGAALAGRDFTGVWCAIKEQPGTCTALQKSKPKKIIYKEYEREGAEDLRRKAKKASQGPV